MILGQLPTWASTQLEQIHLRRPRKDDTIYLYSGNLGLYSFNARTKRGTFQLRNVDESTEEAPAIDWRVEGSMTMTGSKIGKITFVLTQPTSLARLDSYPVRPGDETFEGSPKRLGVQKTSLSSQGSARPKEKPRPDSLAHKIPSGGASARKQSRPSPAKAIPSAE